MLIKPVEKRVVKSPTEWLQLDPNFAHIKSLQQYSQRVLMIWNVDTEELISSTITPLAKVIPLDLAELDTITGASLTVAKNVHDFIIDFSD